MFFGGGLDLGDPMSSSLGGLLACLMLAWHLSAAGVDIVRFPRPEFDGDRRFDYPLQLLQLALSKTGTEYRIQTAEFPMNQERRFSRGTVMFSFIGALCAVWCAALCLRYIGR
jgi:hypothetical protein